MVPFDSFQHFTVGRRQYSTDGPEFSNLGQVFDRISSVKSADMVKKVNARYAHKRNFLKPILKNIEISPQNENSLQFILGVLSGSEAHFLLRSSGVSQRAL